MADISAHLNGTFGAQKWGGKVTKRDFIYKIATTVICYK